MTDHYRFELSSRIRRSNSKYPTSRLRIGTNARPTKKISFGIPPLKFSISATRQTYLGPSFMIDYHSYTHNLSSCEIKDEGTKKCLLLLLFKLR